MKDKRYYIGMQVLTPLNVGAGNDNEWICGIDYVQKDKKVYVLDMEKMVAEGVDVNRMTTLFARADEAGICQLLGNQLQHFSRIVLPSPVKTTNSIKTFLRTGLYDKPLVAGSSLKGAIRSALFKYLRTNEDSNDAVFGTMKDGSVFTRFIRVGDIIMPSTLLLNCKLFNLREDLESHSWLGGWKQGMHQTVADYRPVGFNTLYECVKPGMKGYGAINISGQAFELFEQYARVRMPYEDKKRDIVNGGLRQLFRIVNGVTKRYLQKERVFFEEFIADRTEEIVDCINNLLSEIPDDGSCCVMKMSAGVGFHSITGDWLYDDYCNTGFWTREENRRNADKFKYKSRKVIEYQKQLQLMGFVKLYELNEEEQKAYQAQILDIGNQKEDFDLKVVSEREKQKDLREEEQRKKQTYETLLKEAKDLSLQEKWDEAMQKAQEAGALFPERTEYQSLVEKWEGYKQAQIRLQEEEVKKAQMMSEPLEDVLKEKTSVGNIVGTTGKWLKSSEHHFGDKELSALIFALSALPDKEKKAIPKKRKDFVKSIGEEATTIVFAKMGC